MINFNIISPEDKKIINLNTTELKIKTIKNTKVLFPADNGKVISVDNDTCEGNIMVSFSHENLPYVMSFCNINKINVRTGLSLKEGDTIGYTYNGTIIVSVLDSKNKKVKLNKFEKKETDPIDDRNNDEPPSVSLKTSLFPMRFAHDVVTDLLGLKPKLKEEINRIKELL
jgi:hypothetical protein